MNNLPLPTAPTGPCQVRSLKAASLLLRAFLVGCLLLGFSLAAHAQTWKPLCVNGGGTQGLHNGTWQKLNTPSTGGGTWKPLGACAAATTIITAGGPDAYSGTGYRTNTLVGYSAEGSLSTYSYKGATFAELIDQPPYPYFTVTFFGSLPQNFFSTVTIKGVTFTSASAWYYSVFVNGSTTYTSWIWSSSVGLSNGQVYPVQLN